MEAHTLGLEESCDHFETRILQTPGVVQFFRIDWALLRLFFKTFFSLCSWKNFQIWEILPSKNTIGISLGNLVNLSPIP